jgi:hypothetical protein
VFALFLSASEAAPLVVTPSGHVLVEVAVGDAAPRPFVLDTGASVTTLAPALWDGPLGRAIPIAGAGGATDARLVKEVHLSLGDERLTLPYAVVMDPSDLRELHPDLGGVLGMDVLRQLVVSLDWKGAAIDWSAERPSAPATTLRRARGGLLLVELDLPGGVVPGVLDLGAEATVLNPLARAQAGARRQGDAQAATGVDGELELEPVEVDFCGVVSGGRREPCSVTSAALSVFEVLRLSDVPAAVVGVDLLGGGALVLDARRRELWLDRGE